MTLPALVRPDWRIRISEIRSRQSAPRVIPNRAKPSKSFSSEESCNFNELNRAVYIFACILNGPPVRARASFISNTEGDGVESCANTSSGLVSSSEWCSPILNPDPAEALSEDLRNTSWTFTERNVTHVLRQLVELFDALIAGRNPDFLRSGVPTTSTTPALPAPRCPPTTSSPCRHPSPSQCPSSRLRRALTHPAP